MSARCRFGRFAIVALIVTGALSAQSGGLRSSDVATAGGTITIEVGSNDSQIDVFDTSTGGVTRHDVPPGKNVTVTVPPVPPGTWLIVRSGRGSRASLLVIEVVAP